MLNVFKLLGDDDRDDEGPHDPRAPRSGTDDPHAPRVPADDPQAPRHGAQDPYAPRDDRGEPVQRVAEVGVRYIVDDVDEAIRFYTTHLGFTLDHDASPAFATVSRDGVRLLLSGDGSSGKRALPDGRRQEPGGWNRIHLRSADLVADVRRLRAAGVPFRTPELVTGPGGAQMIIEDPSGNPIELFQPLR